MRLSQEGYELLGPDAAHLSWEEFHTGLWYSYLENVQLTLCEALWHLYWLILAPAKGQPFIVVGKQTNKLLQT